ncbi:heme oxygenase [Marinicrinis lubricantis]|uniref:Heme oxygenase n=1 Tax=Marinicrinis lubricantis TaxID=2086470 RepID=A0ABW1ILC2_9BACL
MYIVTNRIRTKLGFAEKMAPRFTKPGPLQQMKGFVKVEVTLRQNVTEHDELHVNMYWETLEDFEAWKQSDAFREAHRGAKSQNENTESPMLGSEIVISKIVSSIERDTL